MPVIDLVRMEKNINQSRTNQRHLLARRTNMKNAHKLHWSILREYDIRGVIGRDTDDGRCLRYRPCLWHDGVSQPR